MKHQSNYQNALEYTLFTTPAVEHIVNSRVTQTLLCLCPGVVIDLPRGDVRQAECRKKRLAKYQDTFHYAAMNIGRAISNNLSKVVLFLVSGFCLFYAVAFVRLYFMEHPYRVASRWIYQNIPAGSRIIGPHWDDRIPVGLPGFNGSQYQMEGRRNEFPVYEQDTEPVLDLLTSRLSETDYIAFATPRAVDSIPRIPDEYPNTTALLRLLWGEKLGFTLVYSTKNRPNLFGVTFNDDLADESFSVYDHPKVVVFQNSGRLSKEEIKERIANVRHYEPLPSMDEMLLMDKGGWKPTPTVWQPAWTTYCFSIGAVLIFGFCCYVLIVSFSAMRPTGFIIGLAPIAGVLLIGALLYVGERAGLLGFTQQGVLAVGVMFLIVTFVRISSSSKARYACSSLIGNGGGACAIATVIGAFAALLMASVREAPLGISDYVEQAYFLLIARSEVLPNGELFAPEASLSITVIIRLIIGIVLKMVGVMHPHSVSAGYAVAGALLAGVLFAVMSLLFRAQKVVVGATFFLLIPTLYIGFVQCSKANATVAAGYSLADAERFVRLGHWLSLEVKGSPPIAVRCAEDAPLAFSGSLSVDEGLRRGGTLCDIEHPDELYRALMKLGVELYVVDTKNPPAPEGFLAALDSRRDLFKRAYERDALVVYTPAFSGFYARHT